MSALDLTAKGFRAVVRALRRQSERERDAGVQGDAERCFMFRPPLQGWTWDRCSAETSDPETDACRGCAGWGLECWAVWKSPAQAVG